MDIFTNSAASWIWTCASKKEVNEYMEFRHEFVLSDTADKDAKLYISADSDYTVWLNGCFIDCGQYDDYPDCKAYDSLRVGSVLKPGKNVLCVLVYYQGETSFQYIQGEPGLIYLLKSGEVNIASGKQTFGRKSQTYKSGPAAKITMQLGFTFEYDARTGDNWTSCEYLMDNAWKEAQIREETGGEHQVGLYERPINKLVIGESAAARIVSQGVFIRIPDKDKTVAQLTQTDFLSARTTGEVFNGEFINVLPSEQGIKLNPSCFKSDGGMYLLIDLGREEAGLFELDIEAQSGAVVDIAYGEHLDDLRVRAAVGGRNFACRHTCRGGRQKFVHYFKRLAGRYVQLHISCVSEEMTLFYAGVKPCDYPVDVKGSFLCNDNLHNKIYEVAERTLKLCMHEHYEDCPWREQGLYSMDSRNQALCGYYCFGEYDFPQASFALLGEGLGDDGYLEICAPTKFTITIPSFSMAWIIEMADFYLFSGRLEPIRAAMPKIKKMLAAYLKNMSEDLLITPKGERYWNFYEWADGLDGSGVDRNACQSEQISYDAPLNLFFCMALEAAAQLAKACEDFDAAEEYTVSAKRIKIAFHTRFWDEKLQVYCTYSDGRTKKHYAELTQALAISAKACDEDVAKVLRECLAKEQNGLVECTLSYLLYKYNALMEEPARYAQIVFDEIAENWGHMLYNKATTFWETIKGADDFEKAGSLCHGWSAIPIYFYHSYILGVKPVEPGFKSFKAEPSFPGMYKASGKIPTPYGDICVEWDKTGGEEKCKVTNPEGTTRI